MEGVEAVVLEFAEGWLLFVWLGGVCCGELLLPSFVVVPEFGALPDDWKVLLCQRDPLADAVGVGGEGFACAPVSCWEAAASSKSANGCGVVSCSV